jgi:hypothetical protein
MNRRCTRLGFLLLWSCYTSSADTCIGLPIKPIRHLCGIVTNEIGERISNATLTVLKGGVEIKTLQADADGKFEFGRLEAGDYELRAQSEGYSVMQHSVKVVGPRAKCTGGLQVVLGLHVCGSGITKLKR